MAGYIRADITNQIADGNTINAAPLDQEFDAVQTAFDFTTGHRHDGSASEGAPITVIGPVQDIIASASVLRPKTDDTLDLGSSSFEWKNLWIDGTANIDNLVADAGTVGGSAITTAANTQTLTGKTLDLTNNTLVATSAQLLSAVIDETGTGSLVFSVSPAFTGTPTAPTAVAATNTTQLATTAHVFAERSNTATLTNKNINLANNTLVATSAQIAAAVTDETGTGSLVFSNAPTFTGATQFASADFSGGVDFNGTTVDFNSTAVDFNGTVVDFNTASWQFTGASSVTLQQKRSAIGAPTLPQIAVGAGQWLRQTAAATTTFTLPVSGTWAYFYILTNASTNVFISMEASVDAGGTAVLVVPAGQTLNALSWRIS